MTPRPLPLALLLAVLLVVLCLMVGTVGATPDYNTTAANFTADITTGASPLTVQFTDISGENRLSYSEEFDKHLTGGWTKEAMTVSADSVAAPDGNTTADLVAPTATTGQHYFYHYLSPGLSVTSGHTYTWSIFAKKGTGATAPDIVQLSFSSSVAGATQYADYNLSNGSVASYAGNITARMSQAANGFYRLELTGTMTSSAYGTSGVCQFALTGNSYTNGRIPSHAALTTDDVFVWGGQLEEGTKAGPYLWTRLYLIERPTSWKWCFWSNGWNETISSTVQNPSYTFEPGRYNIRMNALKDGNTWSNKSGYIIVSGNYTIIQVPDLQYLTSTYPVTENITFNFLENLKSSSEFDIRALVITGDMVDDGSSIAQWDQYTSAKTLTTIPIYEVVGNHDVIGGYGNWDSYIGATKRTYNATIDDFVFIAPPLTHDDTTLTSGQFAIIQDAIDENPALFPLVVQHHFLNVTLSPRTHIPSPYSIDFFDSVSNDPMLILFGHNDGAYVWNVGNNNIESLLDVQSSGNVSVVRAFTVHNNGTTVDKIWYKDIWIVQNETFGPNILIYPDFISQPVAAFTNRSSYPLSGPAPLTVQFEDLSTNTPTTYNWSWSNSSTPGIWTVFNTTQNGTAYGVFGSGCYDVNLTVSNVAGSDEEVKSNYVCVVTPEAGAATAHDELPWCDKPDLFFWWNDTGDITNYRTMNNVPEIRDQIFTQVSVDQERGPAPLGCWSTPAAKPGVTWIAPGIWRFRTYHNVSSAVGNSYIQFQVFNRSLDGTETDLFYGLIPTKEINTLTTEEYLTSYAKRNWTKLFTGDRLVIKAFGCTTSVNARTISMAVAGNTNASMVSMGWLMCDDDCGSSMIGLAGSGALPPEDDTDMLLMAAITGGMVAGVTVAYLFRKRGNQNPP